MTSRPKGTGCIFMRPDSNKWWIKYSRNGKPYRESTNSTNRRKAEKMLKLRLAEIATGTFVGPHTERVRIEDLWDDVEREYRINGRKSLDDAQARWKLHLKPMFGPVRAPEIGTTILGRYVDLRQIEGAKNATINRELALLKRMFRLGMQATPAKVLRLPSFPKLTENNVRKGFLEDSQYKELAEACPQLWFRAMLECGRTYGWRVSELKNLRADQLDFAERVIRLEPGTTKNGEGREVIMTDAVYTLLRACVVGKVQSDYVFTRENGNQVKDFRETWAKACKAAGVPALLFHDLRRTAARNLRRAGIAEGVIQRIRGWKTRSVFERYAIVTRTDIADAMRKLEAHEREHVTEKSHVFGHSDSPDTKVAKPESIN
jgi:integrase